MVNSKNNLFAIQLVDTVRSSILKGAVVVMIVW